MDKMRMQQQQQQQQQQQMMSPISFKDGDAPPKQLTMEQVVSLLQQQQAQLIHFTNLLKGKDEEIQLLTQALMMGSGSGSGNSSSKA